MNKLLKATSAVLTLSALGFMAATAQAAADKKEAPKVEAQAAAKANLPTVNFDTKKEVAYACGNKGADKVRVMYAIDSKQDEAVLAQVLFQNTLSPVLLRVSSDTDQNRFSSNGITWTAAKGKASQLEKVSGNMLSQSEMQEVNGKKEAIEQIVTKYCEVDKAETAKLAKENAKAEKEAAKAAKAAK